MFAGSVNEFGSDRLDECLAVPSRVFDDATVRVPMHDQEEHGAEIGGFGVFVYWRLQP